MQAKEELELEHDSTVNLWGHLERELGIADRYRILGRIGAGGMGEVFRARQLDCERDVAIKVLCEQIEGTAEATQRFLREAKVLGSLNHPNIVKLYHIGIGDGGNRLYQAVDLLHGEGLDARLKRGPLTPCEFRQIFEQITDALSYASNQGLVHRDIKPANIFLCQQADDRIKAVLLDFGIVRQLAGTGASMTLTSTAAVLGSPQYMSPEQCRGGKVDHRSDIYSLGCTMFQCLAGSPPFKADSVMEIMLKHMDVEPPTLYAFENRKKFEPKVANVIKRCLAKDPDERPQSFLELSTQLAQALDELDEKVQFVAPADKPSSNKTIVGICGALAILLVIGCCVAGFSIVNRKPVQVEALTGPSLSELRAQLQDLQTSNVGVSKRKRRENAILEKALLEKALEQARKYNNQKNFEVAEQWCAFGEQMSGKHLKLEFLHLHALAYMDKAEASIREEKRELIERAIRFLEAADAEATANEFKGGDHSMDLCASLIVGSHVKQAYDRLTRLIHEHRRHKGMVSKSHILVPYAQEMSTKMEHAMSLSVDPPSVEDKLMIADLHLKLCHFMEEVCSGCPPEVEQPLQRARGLLAASQPCHASSSTCVHRPIAELEADIGYFTQQPKASPSW